jgi:hypothetical protein
MSREELLYKYQAYVKGSCPPVAGPEVSQTELGVQPCVLSWERMVEALSIVTHYHKLQIGPWTTNNQNAQNIDTIISRNTKNTTIDAYVLFPPSALWTR